MEDLKTFAVLLSPARQRILRICQNPATIARICKLTERKIGSVFPHMKILFECGLIKRIEIPNKEFHVREKPWIISEEGKKMLETYCREVEEVEMAVEVNKTNFMGEGDGNGNEKSD
jgi:predicted transcriptional regulator